MPVSAPPGRTAGARIDDERIALLRRYRDERERCRDPLAGVPETEGGEANGRVRIGGAEELRKLIPPTPLGPRGFLAGFRALLERSPVVIRPGEVFAGDYYFALHGLIDRWLTAERDGETVAVMSSGHTAGNIAVALERGWVGIASEVRSSLERWRAAGEPERVEYLEALSGVVELIRERIRSYAAEALRLARGATGADRDQYLELGRICGTIADEPPQTFREALQWYWFYITMERSTSSGMGGCRFDSVFLPYYRADLDAGRIDREEARRLAQAFFLKEGLFHSLGGVDERGRDAVNELSFVALEAYDAIGGPSNLNVRWHPSIDRRFFALALDVLCRHRTGVPAIVNDEVIIASLEHFGFTPEQARSYTFAGCFWYVVPGLEYPYHDMETLSGVRVLARTLREAFVDPPATFEALFALYEAQQRRAVDAFVHGLAEVDAQASRHYPEMVVSIVMDGCVERGMDVTAAAEKSLTTVRFHGLATIADSLTAVKKLVYETGEVGLEELATALADDFGGREELRARLAACPKFGNGDEEADAMAVAVAESLKRELAPRRNGKGFGFRAAFYTYVGHAFEGRTTGATPDGRRSGRPFSQGANPAHGAATSGVTALISSVSRIDFRDTAGAPLQLHFSLPSDQRTRQAVEAVVLTTLQGGIPQVNVNFTDRETLRRAIARPEEHRDLVVRVTGYSARFVEIGRILQEEIIERTQL